MDFKFWISDTQWVTFIQISRNQKCLQSVPCWCQAIQIGLILSQYSGGIIHTIGNQHCANSVTCITLCHFNIATFSTGSVELQERKRHSQSGTAAAWQPGVTPEALTPEHRLTQHSPGSMSKPEAWATSLELRLPDPAQPPGLGRM